MPVKKDKEMDRNTRNRNSKTNLCKLEENAGSASIRGMDDDNVSAAREPAAPCIAVNRSTM